MRVYCLSLHFAFVTSLSSPSPPLHATLPTTSSRRSVISSTLSTIITTGFGASIANAVDDRSPGEEDDSPPSQPEVLVPRVASRRGANNGSFIVNDEESSMPWQPPPSFVTQLGRLRMNADELSPLNPSFVPFSSDNELYYAPFLFGTWDTTATLKRKVYPYGPQYLPSKSLFYGSPRNRMEQPGKASTTNYELHYFSAIPENNKTDKGSSTTTKTIDNAGSKLGGYTEKDLKTAKIIADRAFNAKFMSAAYKQLTPVQEVEWDPLQKDPTRLTLLYGAGPLAADMRPLGERKGEVYITARKSELGMDNNIPVFCAAERSRSVTVATGNVVVSDTETITEYRLIDENHIKAISRIAVYLTPNPNSVEGILWQEVQGKAVAFFDYEIDMERQKQDDMKVCVPSFNSNVFQCA